MPPPEARNPTATDPEKCNLAKAQDTDFKTPIHVQELYKHMNKCLNGDCENKHKNVTETIKIFQDTKVEFSKEIQSLKKNTKFKKN